MTLLFRKPSSVRRPSCSCEESTGFSLWRKLDFLIRRIERLCEREIPAHEVAKPGRSYDWRKQMTPRDKDVCLVVIFRDLDIFGDRAKSRSYPVVMEEADQIRRCATAPAFSDDEAPDSSIA
ncbi:hypothetical protein [Streptosporangium minutum]|uniref:hypothetical protein n=1 Tax=Streptosporangium minutum TaxID=569862 RepID=UPI00105589D6|nr:hypothetical protein [Streptosporangium minutum]